MADDVDGLRCDRRLHPAEDVMFREVGGEAVLLHVQQGKYFGLDEVGCRIWRLIGSNGREGVTEAEIIAVLLEEYAVDEQEARRDLGELVRDLVTAGLVVAAPTNSALQPAGDPT